MVRLVSAAPRVKAPATKPRRRPSGPDPAGSGRAARARVHGASVPSAQHGARTVRCWTRPRFPVLKVMSSTMNIIDEM